MKKSPASYRSERGRFDLNLKFKTFEETKTEKN